MGFLYTRSPRSLSISPFPSSGDLPRFGVLRMSCLSLSHIATFVSQLVSLFSSTCIYYFSYPFSFFSMLINRCLASWTTCLLVYITCFLALFTYVLVESLFSHDSSTFGIAHIGVWHYLLGIWAFVSHHFIHLSPLAYLTSRVVRPPEAMRSRVCFNAFYVDRFYLLIEYRMSTSLSS